MNGKSEHLTDELLDAFNNNTLDNDTYLNVLNHISSCEKCSSLFIDSFSKRNMLVAPHYLKSSIMERIEHSNEVVQMVQKKKASINRQLFFYSLKVGLAMCGALIFLYSGMLNMETNIKVKEFPAVKMDTIDKFNNKLYEFSNKLIMEENNYDQEKR